MYSPRLFFRDFTVATSAVLMFAGVVWSFATVILKIHPNKGQVFLHYNIIFGVDWVGDWWKMWFLPASIAAAVLVNIFAAWWLYGRNSIFAKFLLVGGVVTTLFGCYALSLVVGLNV